MTHSELYDSIANTFTSRVQHQPPNDRNFSSTVFDQLTVAKPGFAISPMTL